LPLINQVRIVVHCPVPLLSSQYNIRNGATRGEKNRRIIPPRVASRSNEVARKRLNLAKLQLREETRKQRQNVANQRGGLVL
jgi:hypothetical protein